MFRRRSRFESDMIARRISAHAQPVETPDTDAATVYRQNWRRRDGMTRNFVVLALDEEQAQEFGGVRLKEKYNQHILDWELLSSEPIEKTRAGLMAVLGAEDPDETKAREEAWHRQHAGDPNPFEVGP